MTDNMTPYEIEMLDIAKSNQLIMINLLQATRDVSPLVSYERLKKQSAEKPELLTFEDTPKNE